MTAFPECKIEHSRLEVAVTRVRLMAWVHFYRVTGTHGSSILFE